GEVAPAPALDAGDGPDAEVQPPECPESCGVPTACSTPTCDVDTGTCDPGFTRDDPGDPTPGDCQRDACTGDRAETISMIDDSDVPADLPCSDRGCAAGAITTPVLGEGAACIGDSGVCDGLGTGAASCRTCRDTAGGLSVDAGCSA